MMARTCWRRIAPVARHRSQPPAAHAAPSLPPLHLAQKFGGFSYVDMLLEPLAGALNAVAAKAPAGTTFYLSMQAETARSVVYGPRNWLQVCVRCSAALRDSLRRAVLRGAGALGVVCVRSAGEGKGVAAAGTTAPAPLPVCRAAALQAPGLFGGGALLPPLPARLQRSAAQCSAAGGLCPWPSSQARRRR
jgi:hypothetical protein